mmetsp:Transcript_13541/g.42619  ORF Transcript_13541/g.42619 Transcript_13541/m.42619 type:complete len:225 (+) Transcript_13541:752-1426(+)
MHCLGKNGDERHGRRHGRVARQRGIVHVDTQRHHPLLLYPDESDGRSYAGNHAVHHGASLVQHADQATVRQRAGNDGRASLTTPLLVMTKGKEQRSLRSPRRVSSQQRLQRTQHRGNVRLVVEGTSAPNPPFVVDEGQAVVAPRAVLPRRLRAVLDGNDVNVRKKEEGIEGRLRAVEREYEGGGRQRNAVQRCKDCGEQRRHRLRQQNLHRIAVLVLLMLARIL